MIDGKFNQNISNLLNLKSYLVTKLLVILFLIKLIKLYVQINVYKLKSEIFLMTKKV